MAKRTTPSKKTPSKPSVKPKKVALEAGPKRKPGRPAKPKPVPAFIEALGTNAKIIPVELQEIDLEDRTYQFRVNLRVGDLVASLLKHGQQVPAILRKVEGSKKYQVISGFRRITAIAKIGWASVNAFVLEGISDDDAWRTSVLENEARKTYSDLDRAYAIRRYQEMGHTITDVAESVFKLSRKQATRLKSLVNLPKVVQDAIALERITTTHALVLKQLYDKLGELDYKAWIARITKDELSVGKLRASVLAEQKGKSKDDGITLFVRVKDKGTGREVIRFRPVRVDPSELTREQKVALVTRLEEIVSEIRG